MAMFGRARSSTKSPLPVTKRRSSTRRIPAPIPLPVTFFPPSMASLRPAPTLGLAPRLMQNGKNPAHRQRPLVDRTSLCRGSQMYALSDYLLGFFRHSPWCIENPRHQFLRGLAREGANVQAPLSGDFKERLVLQCSRESVLQKREAFAGNLPRHDERPSEVHRRRQKS